MEVVEQMKDLVARLDVDARRRFVHQQQLGLAKQGAGDEHPLLLAAGELTDVTVGERADAQSLECVCDVAALCPAAPRDDSTVLAGASHEHALGHRDGEAPVDGVDLRDVADPEVLPSVHGAGDGMHGVEQDAQQRCLARTRWTHHPGELRSSDRQVDLDQDRRRRRRRRSLRRDG